MQQPAALGGPGWSPRTRSLREELGQVWANCGVRSEWTELRSLLLHRPGPELTDIDDPNIALMFERLDAVKARDQHDALADAYRSAGVQVFYVEPTVRPAPNQIFVADLFFMTSEGAIVGRPASTVRAGEERWVARRLAEIGVPVLRTVAGHGTFEGADALWIDGNTVLLARGLRTNSEGASQVAATLAEIGVEVINVMLPHGTMHLMGQLRIVDRDLAFARFGRLDEKAVAALLNRGYAVRKLPNHPEVDKGFAHNVVTLAPRQILMPAGRPVLQALYEEDGVTCHLVEIDELVKAAGGIGCMTGVLEREDR